MHISELCSLEKGTDSQQPQQLQHADTASPDEKGRLHFEYLKRETEFGHNGNHHAGSYLAGSYHTSSYHAGNYHTNSTGASPQDEIYDRVFPESATPSPDQAAKTQSNGTQNGTQKRSASDTEDNNSDEEGPEKKQRVVREFACPFFKRNRSKYCQQRSCRTSGWPSVHRVKEHLYRHHMHYVCERCATTFKAPGHLKEHLRQTVACSVSKSKVPEDAGFDLETEKRLRSRKKIEGQTEADKWTHMYQLLFPYASAQCTPSPYVDYSLQEDPYLLTGESEEAMLHPDLRQNKNVNSGRSINDLAAMTNVTAAAAAEEQQILAAESRGIVSENHNMLVELPGPMPSRDRTKLAHASDDELYGCQVVSKTDFYEMVRDEVWAVLSTIPPPSPTHVVRRMS